MASQWIHLKLEFRVVGLELGDAVLLWIVNSYVIFAFILWFSFHRPEPYSFRKPSCVCLRLCSIWNGNTFFGCHLPEVATFTFSERVPPLLVNHTDRCFGVPAQSLKIAIDQTVVRIEWHSTLCIHSTQSIDLWEIITAGQMPHKRNEQSQHIHVSKILVSITVSPAARIHQTLPWI